MDTAHEELSSEVRQWQRAMLTNNAEEIGSFMADDWVIVSTSGGITGKEAFLDVIRSGDLTHNRMDSDEMRVRVHENTAWVTSRGTSAGHYKGEPFSFYEWSADVFVKESGRWKCVLTMLTEAK
ncbi:MAG TPA: nuclear transport factor 2 family protein [Bacteroidia bacterium]|nr:nuclear transport factor 2 family protein [Bacteroidia bacterium]